MIARPLDGIRIVDSTYIFAMPYAAGMMTDMGAEVIKVEGIQHPDRGAQGGGPDNEPGDDPWNRGATFNQLNRGKRSLTLDLSRNEGRDALKELISISDIIIENYTPRVMRGWGMGYENLKKIKPDIIMLSNTGYGHGEGPYTNYPGQATTMEASQGLSATTGYRDGLPDKAGQSYIDFVACWTGLFAVASALRYRNRTGRGQWIDLGMYQLGAYFVSEHVMDFMSNNRIVGRMGNRHPVYAPQGCYPCKGNDRWGVLSVRDDEEWVALCRVMGNPKLADDSRFVDAISRMRNHDELDGLISDWSRGIDRFEMMHTLQDAGIASGAVFDAKDTNMSDHYWERGFEEKVTWSPEREMGTRVLMGRPWKLSKAPLRITEGVHTLGQDNRYVLQELLGRDDSQIQEMENSQMIGDTPIAARRGPLQPAPARGARAAGGGRLPTWYDPDYKKLLGI